MTHYDKIHNPVEKYMQDIMDLDKPEKPPETTARPGGKLEVKASDNPKNNTSSGSRHEALKISDAIKQSVKLNIKPKKSSKTVDQTPRSKIFDIKRHPIGLIYIYLIAIVGCSAFFSAVSFALPALASFTGVGLDVVGLIAGLSMVAITLSLAVIMFFVWKAYKRNSLILTDPNTMKVFQSGIFGDRNSQIDMQDIENVTVRSGGMLSDIFNYGTIIIKTAAGQDDLIFKYAPNPEVCAKTLQEIKLK